MLRYGIALSVGLAIILAAEPEVAAQVVTRAQGSSPGWRTVDPATRAALEQSMRRPDFRGYSAQRPAAGNSTWAGYGQATTVPATPADYPPTLNVPDIPIPGSTLPPNSGEVGSSLAPGNGIPANGDPASYGSAPGYSGGAAPATYNAPLGAPGPVGPTWVGQAAYPQPSTCAPANYVYGAGQPTDPYGPMTNLGGPVPITPAAGPYRGVYQDSPVVAPAGATAPPGYYMGRWLLGGPKLYAPGQPLRNMIRFLTP